MKNWSHSPYSPIISRQRSQGPFICRLAPHKDGFCLDFIDNSGSDSNCYSIYYAKRECDDYVSIPCRLSDGYGKVDISCEDDCDFKVYVEREDGVRSSTRLVRTGFVPGLAITYLHPEDSEFAFSGRYLGSPSLLRTKSGRLLASMDVFSKGDGGDHLTMLYYSDDNGASWRYSCDIVPCFWGKLFLLNDGVYMIGNSTSWGPLMIGRSTDDGKSFSAPAMILESENTEFFGGLHKGPTELLITEDRLIVDLQYGSWHRKRFADLALSISLKDDPLDPAAWVVTEPFELSPEQKLPGIIAAIEGNIVRTPDGKIMDVLRYAWGKSLMLEFDPAHPEERMKFAGYLDIPTTDSKCSILFDERSDCYISLVSYYREGEEISCAKISEGAEVRNLLSLIYSKDLYNWKLAAHVLDYRHLDSKFTGFQYVDMSVDGDDLLFLSRTGFNRAKTYHDSNFMTFHRIENFRALFED